MWRTSRHGAAASVTPTTSSTSSQLNTRYFFFFNDTATTEIYTLSLHDALPIYGMNIISNDGSNKLNRSRKARVSYKVQRTINASLNAATSTRAVSSNPNFVGYPRFPRSEERFSRNAETDLVCRLLLENKNTVGEGVVECAHPA